jgi:TRAP-type transport system periplasmic protein
MKKFCLVPIILMIILGLVLSGCSQSAPATTNKPASPAPSTSVTQPVSQNLITWRYNGTMPADHAATLGAQKFVELVNTRAAGKLKIDYFPNGQVYAANDLPNVLPSGAIQMSECPPNSLNGIVPATAILELPFISPTVEAQMATLVKGKQIIDQELQKKGMKLLYFIDGGGTSGPLTKSKPVKTLEDWKGMTIRSSGAVMGNLISTYGGTPISVNGGEVYGALEKGTVEGVIGGYSTFYQRKWYELCKYYPSYILQYSFFPQVANLDAWNKLPPDVQKIMLDTGEEIFQTQKTAAKDIADTRAILDKAGLQMITLSPEEMQKWKAAAAPLWTSIGKGDPAYNQLVDIAKSNQ